MRKTLEQFIIEANKIHNNKYDYSKFIYIGNKTKGIIICQIHKEFEQTSNSHLRGQGCPDCGKEKSAKTRRMTEEIFVKKANLIHNNKYNYSKVNYVTCETKIIIICSIHGEFKQRPIDHLDGQGCPDCGKEKSAKIRTITKEIFVKRSNKIHNNKYDYSKTKYIDAKTKVEIICPIHGSFWQTPDSHYKGGCLECSGKRKKTKKEFVVEAEKIHNFRYNYSKFIYVNYKTKGIIICSEHGDFKQDPVHHLRGHGCQKCNESKKKTIEEFIKEADEVHNFRYDYSKFVYVNNYTKGIIICLEHGEFKQSPTNHLKGQNCQKCTGNIKMTVEKFIEEADKIHNYKYDYSKVNYINCDTKVTIICPIHGEFKQTPYSHLSSYNCSKCAGNIKKTREKFVEEADKIHNFKYDYSKFVYVNANTKGIIICLKHGEFKQHPSNHLNGKGCAECKNEKARLTVENFITRSNIIHNNKYDYSKFIYINSQTKGIIICPKHGEFEQSPNSHLSGHGCSFCRQNGYSKKCHNWIDSLKNSNIIKGFRLKMPGLKRKIEVDGFDPITNTVYEFNGILYHGSPKFYKPEDINPINKKTFGELYRKTLEKEEIIKNAGYNLVVIWEDEWDLQEKQK